MRNKNKKDRNIDPHSVLEGKVKVTALELVRMIHRVNPTNEDIRPEKTSELYALKARLQSFLIRHFKESLQVEPVEETGPEDPQVIGLRFRHFREDACHALLMELDDDARSWVQRQIDEAMSPGSHRPEKLGQEPGGLHPASDAPDMIPNAGNREMESLSEKELISLGRKALAEYNYSACEDYYNHAFKISHGSTETALCLLELHVDHLAAYEKALDLWESFPMATKKDGEVKARIALAAARNGMMDRALENISQVTGPHAQEVTILAGKHFASQGDVDRAINLLAKLKSFENPELNPEIESLGNQIQQLKIKDIKPVEEKMILARDQGRLDDALKLADTILSQWPQNKAARNIRNDFEKRRRDHKIKHLLDEAHEARRHSEFKREADLLRVAMTTGAEGKELEKSLEHALNEAKLQKEKGEIHKIIKLWNEKRAQDALNQYVQLDANQRGLILEKIDAPHFAWIGQAMSAQPTMKPEKLVEAVLVLAKSKEVIGEGAGHQRVIANLKPHMKYLQSIPEAYHTLKQAEELESARIKEILHKASRFLAEKNAEKIRDSLEGMKVNHLDEDGKKLFEKLNSELHKLENIKALRKSYSDSLKRGDHFTGREIAGRLAGITDQDDSHHWRGKMEDHSSQINKEWSFVSSTLEGLPVCYGLPDSRFGTQECSACILPDGRNLLVASGDGCWLFLRTFSMDEQKFQKGFILRSPKPLGLLNIKLVGNVIWVSDDNCNVIELSLDPFNVLSYDNFSDFLTEKDIVEYVFLFPKNRCFWIDKRKEGWENKENYEIISIDERHIIRNFKVNDYPFVINNGGDYRVAVQNLTSQSVQFYSERGKPIENYPFEGDKLVGEAALHPNRADYVFLTYGSRDDFGFKEDTDAYEDIKEEDSSLAIEVKPDVGNKIKPFKIEGSNGELIHSIFSSSDEGLIFVYFGKGNFADFDFCMAAYKPSARGFEQVYEIKTPLNMVFAHDEFAKKVVALNFPSGGLQAVVLDENEPAFHRDPSNLKKERLSLPNFGALLVCGIQTRYDKAASLAYSAMFSDCSAGDFQKTLQGIRENSGPDEIFACINALQRIWKTDEVEKLKLWMRKQYPDHPKVLMDQASQSLAEKKWRDIISLFAGTKRTELDGESACHICHLLGMAYFAEGDIKRSLEIWKEGSRYKEGGCELEPYINYAKLSLLPEKKRRKKKPYGVIESILKLYETVDIHLSNEEWIAAIESMEKANVLAMKEPQILARLATAYLRQEYIRGEMRWFCKVVVFANFCEIDGKESIIQNHVLPPYIETFSEDRMKEIKTMAGKWLDGISSGD